MTKKFDKIWVGIIAGIVLPLVVMGIFYLSSYSYITVPQFLRKMVFGAIILKLLSLCAVINLGAFFLFYRIEHDKAARGIIFATMILAFVVVLDKVINGGL
ncbi:MAG: riboflavin transporter FmnP [Vicingaceae bacterium]|jgi:riboflavin transporter FmnP